MIELPNLAAESLPKKVKFKISSLFAVLYEKQRSRKLNSEIMALLPPKLGPKFGPSQTSQESPVAAQSAPVSSDGPIRPLWSRWGRPCPRDRRAVGPPTFLYTPRRSAAEIASDAVPAASAIALVDRWAYRVVTDGSEWPSMVETS